MVRIGWQSYADLIDLLFDSRVCTLGGSLRRRRKLRNNLSRCAHEPSRSRTSVRFSAANVEFCLLDGVLKLGGEFQFFDDIFKPPSPSSR